MTRLTPTRTRPDIVAETFKYNRQLALHSHRNEPSLKKQSELFQGETRGETKVTAPYSSQWNVGIIQRCRLRLAVVCKLVAKLNKKSPVAAISLIE